MSLQRNPLIGTSIKEEYLPPPLEKNYLSLFDIQVKMTKEFLPGTEEEKIAIIKKRIKKFFDYGNQEQTEVSSLKKNKMTEPCQIDTTKIKDDLNFDCSKIILYGSEMTTYQTAQKMFPGFIGFERIDESNIKLSFSKKQECQNLLIQNSKDINSILTQHIKNPSDIEWFELQLQIGEQKKEIRKYYARFVTNKDNLLLGNQSHFRKLLGKARSLIDQKESETLQRQKQAEAVNELNKTRSFKTKFIKKNPIQKKYRRNFDQETNYDGVYAGGNSRYFQQSREPIDYRPNYYEPSSDFKYPPRSRYQNSRPNLPNFSPVPIDLEEYSREKRQKSRKSIRNSSNKDFRQKMGNQRQKDQKQLQKISLRDHMIKLYRQKQFTNDEKNIKFARSSETDNISKNRTSNRSIERTNIKYWEK